MSNQFPLVPALPGVPALQRTASNAQGIVATAVGSISGTTLTVTSAASGLLNPGQFLSGSLIRTGTQIVSQLGGAVGGVGAYAVNAAQDAPATFLGASNYAAAAPVASDGPGISQGADASTWGIFNADGSQVIVPDSHVRLGYSREKRVSDFPIEEGGFASYNKVSVPFEGRFLLSKGGSQADRTSFLTSIDDATNSLDLYSLVTPEITYDNVNVVHYDYDRSADHGVTLLSVEVWLRQIRVATGPSFSNTANPSGAVTDAQDPAANDPTQDGAVQPQSPSQSQLAAQARAAEAQVAGLRH